MERIELCRDWIIALAVCVACGGPLRYQTASTARAPGADAEIEADVSEQQGQTRLTVSIKNLPPPDRVAPESQHYVAWYRQGPNAIWQRVAALAYEAEAREASLVASVPEKQFEFEITAEPAVNVASPSPNVVFVQSIGS
ncbi:MAG TPA: hypothetical protein VG963_25480 [Polyangiaceae bacterium]|nr:hypothetical protein [Polyangiaceae bacterium]